MRFLESGWTPPVWRTKRWAGMNALTQELDYWNDVSNGLVVVKCEVNPAQRFHQRNLVYRNNRIWNSEYSYEYWCDGTVSNIVFAKNVCTDAGCGWGHAQRPNPNGSHFMNYPHRTKSVKDFVVCDNVFSNATEWVYRFGYDWRTSLTVRGNKVWCAPGRPAVFWTEPDGELTFYGSNEYSRKLGFDQPSCESENPHVK